MKATKVFSFVATTTASLPVAAEGLASSPSPRSSPKLCKASFEAQEKATQAPSLSSLSSPSKSPLLAQQRRKRSAETTAVVVTPARNANKARKRPSPIKTESSTPRTHSFSACWAGNLANLATTTSTPQAAHVVVVEPHTLILGTHPSIASLTENQYYAHPLNAFWWIAGDCLGFRRDTGISPATGEPYKFTRSLLRHTDSGGGDADILPYHRQLDTLVTSGFALWDVIASCQRAGSLDQAIRQEIPNDVVGFCRAHPSVQRIVLANGGTGAQLFVRHFADWLATGQLVAAENEASQKAFGRAIQRHTKNRDVLRRNSCEEGCGWTSGSAITLVCAMAVSPAAARYTYADKRDFWNQHVYSPGLALLPSTSRETTMR